MHSFLWASTRRNGSSSSLHSSESAYEKFCCFINQAQTQRYKTVPTVMRQITRKHFCTIAAAGVTQTPVIRIERQKNAFQQLVSLAPINVSYLVAVMAAVAGGLGGGGGGGGFGAGGAGGGGKDGGGGGGDDPYGGLSESEWLKKKLEAKKVSLLLLNKYAFENLILL